MDGAVGDGPGAGRLSVASAMKVLVFWRHGLRRRPCGRGRGGQVTTWFARSPAGTDGGVAGTTGLQARDVVVGDALDERAVARAVDGCRAVVHAATVFSFDPRRATDMRRTNARAAELVLRRAFTQGFDPVVHVSTTVALTRYGGSSAALPLGDIVLPYTQSKIDSERVAQELVAAGVPVVTSTRAVSTAPTTPAAATRTSGCAGSYSAASCCGPPESCTWSTCVTRRR